jgi:hypothetical protein
VRCWPWCGQPAIRSNYSRGLAIWSGGICRTWRPSLPRTGLCWSGLLRAPLTALLSTWSRAGPATLQPKKRASGQARRFPPARRDLPRVWRAGKDRQNAPMGGQRAGEVSPLRESAMPVVRGSGHDQVGGGRFLWLIFLYPTGLFFVYRRSPIGYICNQEQGRKDSQKKQGERP